MYLTTSIGKKSQPPIWGVANNFKSIKMIVLSKINSGGTGNYFFGGILMSNYFFHGGNGHFNLIIGWFPGCNLLQR